MDAFDIRVNLKTDSVNLFVVPFEIQSAAPTIGYLLVCNQTSLGSIYLDENYQWSSREDLPWNTADLQMIGREIEACYFLFQD